VFHSDTDNGVHELAVLVDLKSSHAVALTESAANPSIKAKISVTNFFILFLLILFFLLL